MSDPLEPDINKTLSEKGLPLSDVGNERNWTFKMMRDFSFVDMVGQGIRDKVVFEVLDVVFR